MTSSFPSSPSREQNLYVIEQSAIVVEYKCYAENDVYKLSHEPAQLSPVGAE